MTARDRREHRRRPGRWQVFAPPAAAPALPAGRFTVARSTAFVRPSRRPGRWQVYAPPPVVDVGRAGWMLRPQVWRRRKRAPRPQRRRPHYLALAYTGLAGPPVNPRVNYWLDYAGQPAWASGIWKDQIDPAHWI